MNTIDFNQVIEFLKEDAILLDNRSIHYYNWEHIENSINLHWQEVENKIDRIVKNKNQKIITSCQSFLCDASTIAYDKLKKLGFHNIYEYSGGLVDWKNNGLMTTCSLESKIADNIYKIPDQVFYGSKVGSYLIEEKDFILLVDGPQSLDENLLDFILSFDKKIKIFMTHHATAGDASLLQKKHKASIFLHKHDLQGEWLTVKPDFLIEDQYHFSKDLLVIHTPGHSPGSACLLDRKSKILFSGDHLYGSNNVIRDFIKKKDQHDLDPNMRLESCRKLLNYEFNTAYPFHYEPLLEANSKLQNFLSVYN